jgi:hypothetical protein
MNLRYDLGVYRFNFLRFISRLKAVWLEPSLSGSKSLLYDEVFIIMILGATLLRRTSGKHVNKQVVK